jgi:predicted phage-related endonuclease
MTSPNQEDFAPEVRNAAWWSGDSRMAVQGKAADVILQKQGKMPPPDLSDIQELLDMGKIMEPTIARLFQDKHRIELKDADYALSHPTEPWLRSHFDYVSADGQVLVECKNYNMGVMSKFDEETNLVPAVDMVQLIHEAAVHNVSQIYLAVLFGGQKFRTFHFEITPEMKDDLVKTMAELWGYVASGTLPEPETLDACKVVYPTSTDQTVIASGTVEKAAAILREYKAKIKHLKEEAEQLEVAVKQYMGTRGSLMSIDGRTIATWRSSKGSMSFNETLFRQAMPDIYEKFVTETPGSRRFLLK